MSEGTHKRLLVTAKTMSRVLTQFIPVLERNGWDVVCKTPEGQSFSAMELAALTAGFDAVVAGDDDFSREFFAKAPSRMRLIVKWGVGTDSIDHEAAHEVGILVKNTPKMFGAEIADLAMGYVIALSRRIFTVHHGVVEGGWPQPEGISLVGKTIAIVGFGDAGSSLASRAQAFGMDVAFHDPFESGNEYTRSVSMVEVFQQGDFVVLTCPSTPDTRGLVSSPMLSRMKKEAFLVNVSRGELVDEEDLCDALQSGQIAGAALDVFQREPLPWSSPLRNFSTVLFGAHNASNTSDGLVRASRLATEIVIKWGRGDL